MSLRDIVVRYGMTTVLEVPHLDVRAGKLLAVIGPNGAGKSTLLRVMGHLQPPSAGTIFFRGAKAESEFAVRRRIATVFREPLLLNESLYRNAALGLRLRGLSRSAIDARLKPWLERLRLAHLSERAARTLSSGEAQRTSLARALALEPELLLLDEPFAALDERGRSELLADFQTVIRASGSSTVLVTHDRREAYALADHVAVLIAGRLAQVGARDEVFSQPASAAVASAVGFENILPAQVQASDGLRAQVAVGADTIQLLGSYPSGARGWLCVRAEALRLTRGDGDAGQKLRATLTGVVDGIDQMQCRLDWHGQTLLAGLWRREVSGATLEAGNELTLWFDSTSARFVVDDAAPRVRASGGIQSSE